MNTVSNMTVVCILAILVVAISSGRYGMIQVNAQKFQGENRRGTARPNSTWL